MYVGIGNGTMNVLNLISEHWSYICLMQGTQDYTTFWKSYKERFLLRMYRHNEIAELAGIAVKVKIVLIKITVMKRLNISELYNFTYYTRKRLMCFWYTQKYKMTANFKYS